MTDAGHTIRTGIARRVTVERRWLRDWRGGVLVFLAAVLVVVVLLMGTSFSA